MLLMLKLFLFSLILALLAACGQPPRSYLQGDRPAGQASSTQPSTSSVPAHAGQCREGSYVVARNDSLSVIAVRCKVSLEGLAKENNLFPPYVIYPGQELVLPNRGPVKQVSKVDWRWPVDHLESFAYVKDSQGIQGLEVYGEVGTLVKAVDDGEVVFAENSLSNFGFLVMIRHKGDYLTIYAHNQRIAVTEGQSVKAGEVIANLGQTGVADRPKLYFEVRHLGRKVNAESLLGRPR